MKIQRQHGLFVMGELPICGQRPFKSAWARLFFLALVSWACHIQSDTFFVTNNLDSGPGSLRQAISDANLGPGGTILFSNVTGPILLTSGELNVNQNLLIVGPGPARLAIDGNNTDGIFYVNAGVNANFSGLTIQNGLAYRPGGGVCNLGNLVLDNCVLIGNSSHPRLYANYGELIAGGAIYNAGNLAVTNCVLTSNYVDYHYQYPAGWVGHGAGIFNEGNLVLSESRIQGNWCEEPFACSSLAGGSGGGVYNASSATIIFCNINNNRAGNGNVTACDGAPGPGGRGGGIFNEGTMFVLASTINANLSGFGGNGVFYGFWGRPGGEGGGIFNSAQLTLIDCTISGNTTGDGGDAGPYASQACAGGSGGNGGGLANTGNLSLTNCTLYGNSCGKGGDGKPNMYSWDYKYGSPGGNGGSGGAIWNSAAMSLVNCTIAQNSAGKLGTGDKTAVYPGANGLPGTGGGIAAQFGSSSFLNTLIANNHATSVNQDFYGTATSLGYNLLAITNGSIGFAAVGDLLGVDPLLAPLANNGGPTWTCALLPASPAIDAGTSIGAPAFDQRGIPRPFGLAVDIGACEFTSQILAQQMASQYLQLSFSGYDHVWYRIEKSSDLKTWFDLGWTRCSNHLATYLDWTLNDSPHAFYRLSQTNSGCENLIAFEAESIPVKFPFLVWNGCVFQDQGRPFNTSGRLKYPFTISEPGQYIVQIRVSAPHDGANSIYLNIDAEPEDPKMICDFAITTGFQWQTASWRGEGGEFNNQFAPVYFTLNAGQHHLFLYGREGGTLLDKICITKVD